MREAALEMSIYGKMNWQDPGLHLAKNTQLQRCLMRVGQFSSLYRGGRFAVPWR